MGIKCPYQKCPIILNQFDLHVIINKNQKNQKNLLQKYQENLTENFLIQQHIIGFKQIDKINQKNCVFFYCSTPGCNAAYQLNLSNCFNYHQQNTDKPKKVAKSDFLCIKCQKAFCLDCFDSLHPSMSCQQFKVDKKYLAQDKLFQEYLTDKGKKYKRCPRCLFWVDNWRGCITVKCRCGVVFCYKCGKIGCPHGQCLNIK